MSKLTRRGALGLLGGAAGLQACAPTGATGAPVASGIVDDRPTYSGAVAFDHGVASGDPLQTAVILWSRVTPAETSEVPIYVDFEVFEDADMQRLSASGSVQTSAARDYTVKVDANGLQPGRDYYYRFSVRTDQGLVESPTGRTRTLAQGGDTPVKLAVISCSNFPFGRFNVYNALGQRSDLDAIVHLGDYIYEYGVDGYGGEVGEQLGRRHDPTTEIVSLSDYRTRHAQYKADPDLQAAHASAPWLCTWDDHESTNNSYRTGAQNHNPEENEGDWTARKQIAVQAYLEWMPVRDPQPGRMREAIYRKFEFGDVATIFCLESRLTGRSEEISWFEELGGKAPAEAPFAAAAALQRVNDPARTMLGPVQEDWLADGFTQSVERGAAWQVLANQVIMAQVKPPNLEAALTDAQKAAQDVGYIQQLIPFSQLGLPWNLDAWDGFPAARARLYAAAKESGARLVTLTGDTHTAWANTLHDADGDRRGVEFGCTAVTSPGLGLAVKEVPELGDLFAEANRDIEWYDPFGRGFIIVTLTADAAKADYFKVSTVTEPDYEVSKAATFETRRDSTGRVGALKQL